MAYAIIKTGGKQYRVAQGETLDVELISTETGTVAEGDTAVFQEVLFSSIDGKVTVGAPTIPGAKVTAEVVGEVRAAKVTAFKYRRRKGYHRTIGHRQRLTRVKIKEIAA